MLRDAIIQFFTYSFNMRIEDANARTLPLFPLNTVLMPGQLLPLHIFENKYRSLISDLLAMPEVERKIGRAHV